ncbi:MAG: hypothetical protein K6C05_01740 [Anaerovibrio sp.]|nr:hypothetical protein [Anaerovibrio sp.]MCR5175552.1 hypothetical protein [Anaerovibrio sp.]
MEDFSSKEEFEQWRYNEIISGNNWIFIQDFYWTFFALWDCRPLFS